ncbi:MAG TPA: hypothetical protein VHM02_06970, partial [Thermoanaerobaculia bacterium]|nr:hypothetical protein [Thermoanaerobaculia bacterium]
MRPGRKVEGEIGGRAVGRTRGGAAAERSRLRLAAGAWVDRVGVVLRIFPWGWHREVSPARLGERVARAYRRDEHGALWGSEA